MENTINSYCDEFSKKYNNPIVLGLVLRISENLKRTFALMLEERFEVIKIQIRKTKNQKDLKLQFYCLAQIKFYQKLQEILRIDGFILGNPVAMSFNFIKKFNLKSKYNIKLFKLKIRAFVIEFENFIGELKANDFFEIDAAMPVVKAVETETLRCMAILRELSDFTAKPN